MGDIALVIKLPRKCSVQKNYGIMARICKLIVIQRFGEYSKDSHISGKEKE